MNDTSAQKPGWRWLRRALAAIGVLLLVALAAAAWVVRNLDTGWVKERLRDLTGLQLDYTDAKLKILSGIHLVGLTVASGEAWRGVAPQVLEVGGLDLGWSLFSKHGSLQNLIADDVEITIAVDEHGNSSLGGLRRTGVQSPAPPEGPLLPGHLLAHLMEQLPEFGRVAISRANLTLLRVNQGRVIERARLTGITLNARSHGSEPLKRVQLALGSHKAKERLALDWRTRGNDTGGAAGTLWLEAKLDGETAEVHGELAYERQTLSKAWPKTATLLAVDLKARAQHDTLAVELDRFELVDSALTAKGAIDVEPERAHVIKAQGKIDLARLLRLSPPGLLPVELREGHARYDVALLEVSAAPTLDPKGRLEIDGALAGVRLSGSTALSLDHAKLEVRGRPTAKGGGLHLTADLPAGTLHVEGGGMRGNANGMHLSASATFTPGAAGQLDARARFDALSGDGPPGQLAATVGDLSLKLADTRLDPRDLRAFGAGVALSFALGSLEVRRPEARLRASDVRLDAHTRVDKGAPGVIALVLPLGSIEVVKRGETVLPAGPARLSVRLDHAQLDRAAPARSTADGRIDLAVGPITLGASLRKHSDELEFDLALDAKRTALLTAFAPESLELPGARMAAKLTARGRIDVPGASKLRAQAALHLDQPGATLSGSRLTAAQLDAGVSIDGSLRKQTLSFTLEPRALSLDDERLGDGRLTAEATWDLARPSLKVHLEGRGAALPAGTLALTASIDKKTRALTYAIDGDLAHLAALEPLLPASLTDEHWIDLSDLKIHLGSHGTLTGLVRAVDGRGGLPELEPHPLYTLTGDDATDLSLAQVHYVDAAGVELTLPSIELSARVRAAGGRRTAELSAHLAQASVVVGAHKLDVRELRDSVTLVTTGDPRSGELEASHDLSLERLGQDWLRAYPIAHLTFSGHARRGSDGTLHVEKVLLDNQGGGTRLAMSGSLILPRTLSLAQATSKTVPLVGFRSMTLQAALEQKLDPLAGDPLHFKGTGSLALLADVASSDLHRFHVVSTVRLRKASIALPDRRFSIVGLDGTLPLVEDVHVANKQATLAQVHETNAYPTLRFSDQHPFLPGTSALTADSMTFGELTFSRVAGNLRLQRNLFAVDQLEAEVRGGRIAGQCLVALSGLHSTLQLRLRLSGIAAKHGGKEERFDGNAALAFSAAERTIEGRAEILHIGRYHLFDLLDGYDPHHTDAQTNRVRTALSLGYPDHVRVLFDHGFASFSVAFGGLARLVRVHEVQGIPTGPLVDRYLGGYLGPLLLPESSP